MDRRIIGQALVALLAAAAVAGCTTTGDGQATEARATAAALGVAGGADTGPTGAGTADTRVPWRLNEQEYLRLNDAARRAFAAPQGQAIAYTIEPQNIDAEPTAVSATPVGPTVDRDGTACRPMRLVSIKGGRASSGTFLVCRAGNGIRIAGRA